MSSKKFLARDRLHAACQKVRGIFKVLYAPALTPYLDNLLHSHLSVLTLRYCKEISGTAGLLDYLQLLSGQDQVH